jgi:hypothetical protein
MAFGLPGTDSSANFDNGPRIQYDARFGGWKRVERVQGSDGSWGNDEEDLLAPSFVLDFRTLEVGWLKFSSPPSFMLAPYGGPVPPQPEELGDNKRRAFQPGFRLKLLLAPKRGLHTFSHNSKTVLGVMDELHQAYMRAPEARLGQVPVIGVTGKTVIEIKNKEGTSKFYAPKMEITAWIDRPEVFGPATSPIPAPSFAQEPVSTAPPATKHVGPPVTQAAPAPAPAAAFEPDGPTLDDSLPF